MRFRIFVAVILAGAFGASTSLWLKSTKLKPIVLSATDPACLDYQTRSSVPGKTLAEADMKTDAQAKALNTEASQILANVKKVCDDYHLRFEGSTGFSPKSGTINGIVSAMRSPDSDFSFWMPRQELSQWDNHALENVLNAEGKAHPSTTPSTPKWSKARAIEIGTAFLHAFLNGTNVRLTDGDAYFNPSTVPPISGSRGNRWILRWKRLDSQGHRFYGDEFNMEIPEGCAPIAVNFSYLKPYVEEKGKMMSQAEAMAIARRVKDRFLPGPEILTTMDDSMHLEDEATSPEVALDRLIWIFWVVTPNYPTNAIYIDAYTGEYEVSLSI